MTIKTEYENLTAWSETRGFEVSGTLARDLRTECVQMIVSS